MQRREFMKVVAAASLGMTARGESVLVKGVLRPHFHLWAPQPEDDTTMQDAQLRLWGGLKRERKTITTIHKDGLDVRFIKE